jgi:hypothetical protein
MCGRQKLEEFIINAASRKKSPEKPYKSHDIVEHQSNSHKDNNKTYLNSQKGFKTLNIFEISCFCTEKGMPRPNRTLAVTTGR